MAVDSFIFIDNRYEFFQGGEFFDTFYLPNSFLETPAAGDISGTRITEDAGHHRLFLSNLELSDMGFASVAAFTAQFDIDKADTINVAAGGSDNFIQFSTSGTLDADINLQFDKSTEELLLSEKTTIKSIGGSAVRPNIAIGTAATGQSLTSTAYSNILIGSEAGQAITTGEDNTLIGVCSGYYLTTGVDNTSIGSRAGYYLTTGSDNTLIGKYAGYNLTTGNKNLVIGYRGLFGGYGTTLSSGNIILGEEACFTGDFTGSYNVIIGRKAGFAMTGASANNIAIGQLAGDNIDGGYDNVLIGRQAGDEISSGDGNILLGRKAGSKTATGTKNICIGQFAGRTNTGSKKLFIGYGNIITGNTLIEADLATADMSVNGALSVISTTQAFTPPVMTGAQATAIGTGAAGNIIYVTSTNGVFASVGFWGQIAGTWTALH